MIITFKVASVYFVFRLNVNCFQFCTLISEQLQSGVLRYDLKATSINGLRLRMHIILNKFA